MLEITKQNFEKEVLKSQTPVIIDFWAEWCGPCKLMGPVFEELSKEYKGKLKFAKVNVDKNQSISEEYDVRGIPALVVFNKGDEVDRIVGYAPKPMIKEKIDAILKECA